MSLGNEYPSQRRLLRVTLLSREPPNGRCLLLTKSLYVELMLLARVDHLADRRRPFRATLQACPGACNVDHHLFREFAQDHAELGDKPFGVREIIAPVSGEEGLNCPRDGRRVGFRIARQAVLLPRRRRIASERFHGSSP
jgi:hypothetical protein